jgi:exo-1,4-beta-D-glucosaminidase
MFEAYLENKYSAATGIIQWMMNSAWPSLEWNLFDYYLRPGGAYFGAKSANEPVHVMYSLRDGAVVLANQAYDDHPGLEIGADVYDLKGAKVFSKSAHADLGPDAVVRSFQLPESFGSAKTYFLRLTLKDQAGSELSRNYYWLSHRKEIPGPGVFYPFYLPTIRYADFKELDALPKAALSVSSSVGKDLAGQIVRKVTVTNPSSALAFAVRLKVDNASGDEILPVLWQDNYFALLPGETRTLEARYAGVGDQEHVEWSGWNVEPARD